MAPFTISSHHPLPYQCCLPQEVLMQSKMSPELLSRKPGTNEDLPLNFYRKTSIMKIRLHLWHVIGRVVNCCMSVAELFCAKMFFFMCVGKNMTMTGELKKFGAAALERETVDGKDPEMKVVLEFGDEKELIEPAVGGELSVIDSDDEAGLSEWESDEETDDEEEEEEEEDDEDNEEEDCEPQDVDSEWSDEDESDSEASAESLELWESFLNTSDPYNPLSFCSSTGSRTNSKQNQQTLCSQTKTQSTRPEECHPKTISEEGGKKVRFSDTVTVHPLEVWSFASRAARDGSCWLQMARDRERFRRRVENTENVLKPCLTPEHRASVWERLQRKT